MNKKPVIVLVEDDDFISEMYALKFKDGYDVHVARDGAEGLEMIKKVKPDLVLLDIILPQLDGFEVLERVKKEESVKDIPVILLTNLGQKQNVKKGLRLGAVDYVIKAHYTPSEVVEKVNKVLADAGRRA
ncbi:hypothetical protein A3F52_03555 [Candidatus Uhrbacteria bacterium RIFCSPHIGHO2_12_FULL_47_11]|nr:MAG: hypothetical protein A3F52_03555 [Candidatus Uhrbacteria bacterium RIFCSPHIGHO2_12_FULL_47_11]